MTRIGVLGAGAFGTALAAVLARGGGEVTLWGRDAAALTGMETARENDRYLPGIKLPQALRLSSDLNAFCTGLDALLIAVPAQRTRDFLRQVQTDATLVMCAKGIEGRTGALQHDIAGQAAVAVLSGPGFAAELAAGKPTALSLGCADDRLGARLQEQLSTPEMRLYRTTDITGVALGGALKNVYAIACGIVVGADLGESARAALMTRGFAEMVRLSEALGARAETLNGLSGLGDLALSCTSAQSRNFAHGQALGAAGTARQGTTVEGIATAAALLDLAQTKGIDLPIARAVANVLAGRMSTGDALRALMARPLKRE